MTRYVFIIFLHKETDDCVCQDSVNLPNVAKLFWTHADEERDHAIQFMQYLRMRGAEDNEFFAGGPIQPKARTYDWQGVGDVSCKIPFTIHTFSVRFPKSLCYTMSGTPRYKSSFPFMFE